MTTISIATASTLLGAQNATKHQWIDVRSASEYASGHIPGAVNIPMDQMEARLDDLAPACRSSSSVRPANAPAWLPDCSSHAAPTSPYSKAERPHGMPPVGRLVASVKSSFSLERQVRLIAGVLVLIGVILSLTVQRNWIFLAAYRGCRTHVRRPHRDLPDGRLAGPHAMEPGAQRKRAPRTRNRATCDYGHVRR